MIYALALGTNIDHAAALRQVHTALTALGEVVYSPVYELPDRAGRAHLVYWNQAALLTAAQISCDQLLVVLDQIEQHCGRVRPSQYVRMDIDLIAVGERIDNLTVVRERLPLPMDVILPMRSVWPACPIEDPLALRTPQNARIVSLSVGDAILHTDNALR